LFRLEFPSKEKLFPKAKLISLNERPRVARVYQTQITYLFFEIFQQHEWLVQQIRDTSAQSGQSAWFGVSSNSALDDNCLGLGEWYAIKEYGLVYRQTSRTVNPVVHAFYDFVSYFGTDEICNLHRFRIFYNLLPPDG
jgi:hypothetical protein